jgi:hypothetical protein
MNNATADIKTLVDNFTAGIAAIAQHAAVAALNSAFSAHAPKANGHTSNGHTHTSNGHTSKVRARNGSKGAKRDPAVLAAIAEKFKAFVAANPGQRIEQINREMGTTTHELMLPIRKLIAEGQISSKGRLRSTTYFAGGAGAAKAKTPSKKASAKKASAKKASATKASGLSMTPSAIRSRAARAAKKVTAAT